MRRLAKVRVLGVSGEVAHPLSQEVWRRTEHPVRLALIEVHMVTRGAHIDDSKKEADEL